MTRKKTLGSDLLNQQQIWRSVTRRRTAGGSSSTAAEESAALLPPQQPQYSVYIYKNLTSRLLRRHLNHPTYFFTGTKEKNCIILDSNHGQRQGDSDLHVHLLRFLHDELFDCYVSNRRLEKNGQKTKKHPPQGDDASMV